MVNGDAPMGYERWKNESAARPHEQKNQDSPEPPRLSLETLPVRRVP